MTYQEKIRAGQFIIIGVYLAIIITVSLSVGLDLTLGLSVGLLFFVLWTLPALWAVLPEE